MPSFMPFAQDALAAGVDPYVAVAAEFFHVHSEDVTSHMRRLAKETLYAETYYSPVDPHELTKRLVAEARTHRGYPGQRRQKRRRLMQERRRNAPGGW